MKTIALVSHDRRKMDMVEWAVYNADTLSQYHLVCTGTTGTLIKQAIASKRPDLTINIDCVNSGPLGGDAEIAALIAKNMVHLLIFLEDDMQPNPHVVDIGMLERQARLHNIFVACNRSTADCLLASPLFYDETYQHLEPQYIEFDRKKFDEEHKLINTNEQES